MDGTPVRRDHSHDTNSGIQTRDAMLVAKIRHSGSDDLYARSGRFSAIRGCEARTIDFIAHRPEQHRGSVRRPTTNCGYVPRTRNRARGTTLDSCCAICTNKDKDKMMTKKTAADVLAEMAATY